MAIAPMPEMDLNHTQAENTEAIVHYVQNPVRLLEKGGKEVRLRIGGGREAGKGLLNETNEVWKKCKRSRHGRTKCELRNKEETVKEKTSRKKVSE